MAKYIRRGSDWHVSSDAAANYVDSLPIGNYIVKKDINGFYLEETNTFSIGRIYGDAERTADRVLRTFIDRDKNTGVLAVGDKGTGKTLLTKLVSMKAAKEYGIPTILINDPHYGDDFNSFIASIDGRCIVLLDEFEKSYKKEAQEALLTLFDGVYQMNKLFLLTSNSEYEVNRCMISRPGRIYYYLEYGSLDCSFIEEYCQDNLNDKSMITAVSEVAEIYGNFSFDVLKAIIDEMNRYNEPPHAVLKYLNIQMDYFRQNRTFSLKVTRDGSEVTLCPGESGPYSIDPRRTEFEVEIIDDDDKIVIDIGPDQLVSVKKGGNVITYKYHGYDIIACHTEREKFDPLKSFANGYH